LRTESGVGRPAIVVTAIGLMCGVVAGGVRGASRPDLSGTWTLNRELSEFPRETGFDPDWLNGGSEKAGETGTGRSGGGGRAGRTGRSGGGGSIRTPGPGTHFESEEDTKKIQELVNEVKNPPVRMTIVQTDTAVTISDARGWTRTVHAGGKEETLQLNAGPIGVVTKWEDPKLVIRYLVEKDRELRYRYSRTETRRLAVEVQFAEHGHGDVIKRVYDAAGSN
jgi:hypothetical protein